MEVLISSKNNPVNGMTVLVSWLVNDLDKDMCAVKCLFGW